MAKKLEAQNNFNTGEISPRLYSRVDVNRYDNALETAQNCQVLPHGPVRRRNGSQYIAEVKDSSKAVRLLRFQFAADDALILEFGNLYIRFYTDLGQLAGPLEVTTTYTEAQLSNIAYTQFGNIIYLTHPDHTPRTLTRTNNTTWLLEDMEFSPEPSVELGEFPATTLTPAATTGLGINFVLGSSVFLTGDIGRRIVNKTSGETGVAVITALGGASPHATAVCDITTDFTDTNAIAGGDWQLDLSPVSDITPTGTTLGTIITITADEPGIDTGSDTFRNDTPGKFLVFNGGIVKITEWVSLISVKGEVVKTLTTTDETSIWTMEECAWSATRGYPRTVGLFQQRLVFGGTVAQPQTLWFSEVGIFNGFGIGSEDADSISVDISSNEVNQIEWLAVTRDLIIGTGGSEHSLDSGVSSGITPTSVRQIPRTYFGSSLQKPVTIGNEILFIQKSGRKVLSYFYDFGVDGYRGQDLTFLSEHLTLDDTIAESGVKELAYSQEPDSHIYAVLNNGNMLVGTYVKEESVLGWTEYQDAIGTYENVQTISENGRDEVWVVVNRTIDGSTVRYIEAFDDGTGEDTIDGFSDSYLTYSVPKTISGITKADPAVVTATSHGFSNGETIKILDVTGMTEINNRTAVIANVSTHTFEMSTINSTAFTTYTSGGEAHEMVSTLSGLTHLEGETVQIKGDGATLPDETVSTGSITLDRPVAEAVVGLQYSTTIKTLRIEFDIGLGSMQGQRVRWVRPIVRVYKSTKPLLNGEFLPNRSSSDNMDESVPLYSGDLEYGPLDWGNTGQLSLTVTDPLPLEISGISGAIDSGVV